MLTFIICGLAFFIINIKRREPVKTLLGASLVVIAMVLVYQMKIPEERFHILEYMVLGWFTAKDALRNNKKIRNIFLACTFVIMVGLLDELFQKFLPYRVYDKRDMILNGLGGIGGVLLYTVIR